MSLWCSLLGHRFDESEVERERQERGDEVLTMSREVEVCGRCGARRVVAENTEVTPIESPAEPDVGAENRSQTAEAQPIEPRDPAEEDTEILEESDPGRPPGEWPPEPGEEDTEEGEGGTVMETVDDETPEAYHCPECGFTTNASGSSLRPGDSCPECRRGYLETP